MGSDMANTVKAGKSSNSNLKVPPLKIVLNSHQNNSAVVNSQNQDEDDQPETRPKNEHEYIIGTEGEANERHVSRKNSRSTPDRKESDQAPTASKGNSNSSGSSSNTGSDRSTSTSPSSESESLDSNLTIISDNHQSRVKTEHRDETHTSKQERASRHNVRHEKSSNSHSQSSRRPEEHPSESTGTNKEQSSTSNQRITRSSQRAAQQNKTDSQGELNNDEPNAPEAQDKTVESARKVKRRKGEQQDTEQDNGQQATQQPILMANICPADYQLPTQNSFELYRDIRKRPYRKMLQLNHVQPKVPQGFKDYLLNSGPYLLDGNRLGVGFSGGINNPAAPKNSVNNGSASSRIPLRIKLSNLQSKSFSSQGNQQRHNNYLIPKLRDAPKSLRIGSPLYELFQDQEKARHQMRMQHLKERERSVLAAEQEILRAYNRVAIADNRQELHLSACTYFYYQERYHYVDDTLDTNRQDNKSKEIPHNQDNSNLCIDAPNTTSVEDQKNDGSPSSNSSRDRSTDADPGKSSKGDMINRDDDDSQTQKNSEGIVKDRPQPVASSSELSCDTASVTNSTDSKQEDKLKTAPGDKESMQVDEDDADKIDQQTKPSIETNMEPVDGEKSSADMSDSDLKVLNKSVFINQLQEIDDKWAKIKREMFIRHKNESDSLYAVQSLEWEWKAKEIGACDVRVTLKIEPEYVPRVEVSDLDY